MPGMNPDHRPPVLDMTPEGEFRDPPRPTGLDAVLSRIGGLATLVGGVAGAMLVVALAIVFIGVLIPVVVTAGLIGFGSLWWRARRARQRGEAPGFRFVVIRR